MMEKRNTYRNLVGKTEGKMPLGRSRCRWEGNIEMNLTGIGGSSMDWTDLAKNGDQWRALVNMVIGFHEMLGNSSVA
jgi:hypothetical protein